MAILTDTQLATARLELGATVDEDDLQERYDRLMLTESDPLAAAITEVLLQRYADLLAAPAKFSAGDYSQDTSENMKALAAQLAARNASPTSVVGVVPPPDRWVR